MSTSYRKLERKGPYLGFITQVYDSANFDIDIDMPSEVRDSYKDVYAKGYIAIDMDEPRVSSKRLKSYRCRIRGIVVDKNRRDRNSTTSARLALAKIERRAKLYNSWVLCYVNEIDQYNRILVELCDPITGESMTDDIFEEHPEVFKKYVKVE